LKKIHSAYALLLLGVITLSTFAGPAFAQQMGLGGVPSPVEGSELFIAFMETNLLWIIPVGIAGVVIAKLKFKEN